MDLKTAARLSPFAEGLSDDDVVVGNFILRMGESDDSSSTSLLKEKFELKLQIERNLDKAFNHRVPDLSVKGKYFDPHLLSFTLLHLVFYIRKWILGPGSSFFKKSAIEPQNFLKIS